VPALRMVRDPQGLPRLEGEGVCHVPVHRLADGLLVVLHRHNEADNLQGLLYIAYGFHVPLMIAAVILAYSFISIARGRMREEAPSPGRQRTARTSYP
jgi:hypothetical protein